MNRVFSIYMVTALIAGVPICARAQDTPQPSQAPAQPPIQAPAVPPPAPAGPVAEGAPALAPCIPLDQAIDIALRNNPQVSISLQQIERARGQIDEAQARQRVNLEGNATYTVQGPQESITFPTTPGEPPQTVDIVQTSNARARLTATQPIDISGRLRIAEQLAGLNERIQVFGLSTTRNDTALNVKTAYYNVLRAYAQRDTAQAAVNAAEEQLRVARAQFEAGTSARFDVTQAEVRVANLQQVLINATNSVRLAKAALNTILGQPANTPIEVQRQTINVDQRPLDADALIQTAYANRPEVKAAQTGVALAERNITFVQRQLSPSLAVIGNVNWVKEVSGFTSNNVTWDATAAINVPIFDGGVTRAQVRQARADAQISRERLDQAQLGVSLDVQNAVTDIRNARERVQYAQANVALGEENLRLARVRFDAQVGTSVEVTQAEQSLNEARLLQINAYYDYVVAVAQLQRAVGIDSIAVAPALPGAAPAAAPAVGS